MKAKAIICGGIMVCATFFSTPFSATAQENSIGGDVTYTTDVKINKLEAEGGYVGIGAFSMTNGSAIGGGVKMEGNGVKVTAGDITANGQEMQIGGFKMDSSEVTGDVILNQKITIQDVEASKGSKNTLIGGAQILNNSFVGGNFRAKSEVTIDGKVTNHGDLNVGAVRISNAEINGDANFDLFAHVNGKIDVRDEESAVYIGGANIDSSQIGSVDIKTHAETGAISASNGATIRIADANISGVNMAGSTLNLDLTANVGDVTADGANVEIGSFTIN